MSKPSEGVMATMMTEARLADVITIANEEEFSHIGVKDIGVGQFRTPCENDWCEADEHFYTAFVVVTDDGATHRFVLDDDEARSLGVGITFSLGVTSAYEYGLDRDVFNQAVQDE